MLLHRMDVTECHTALEVKLLAALVRERKLCRELLLAAQKPAVIGAPAPPETKPDFPFVPIPEVDPHNPIIAGAAGIRQIQFAVGRRFDVPLSDMCSRRRRQRTVIARHVALLLCYTLTAHSHPEIGRMFGGRDHTTSLHAVRKMHWLQRELELELRRDDLLIAWVDLAFVKTGEITTKVLPWPLMTVA